MVFAAIIDVRIYQSCEMAIRYQGLLRCIGCTQDLRAGSSWWLGIVLGMARLFLIIISFIQFVVDHLL